jgi:acyl carrier protein
VNDIKKTFDRKMVILTIKNVNDIMKTKEKVIEIINQFLHEEFEVELSKIKPAADLKSTLELDSLDYIDLVVVMEKNLHIKVDPADLIDIHTIQDLYTYVIAKMDIQI